MAEPVRVRRVGGIEGLGPLGANLLRGAVVHRGRRVVADARVAVLVVVVMWVILSRGSFTKHRFPGARGARRRSFGAPLDPWQQHPRVVCAGSA